MDDRAVPPRRTASLFVGIDEYTQMSRLRFACADAEALRDQLTDRLSGQLDADESILLLDQDATLERLQIALADTLMRPDPVDCAFVFFAGHAMMTTSGEAHLALAGASPGDIERYGPASTRSLPMRRLREEFLRAATADHVVLVLDCCHSGFVHPPGFRSSTQRALTSEEVAHDLSDGLRQTRRNLVVISACAENEAARETAESSHGHFTAAFLEALGGRAEDRHGSVTVQAAFDWVARQELPQTPRLTSSTEAASLVLVQRPMAASDSVVDLREAPRSDVAIEVLEPSHHLTRFTPLVDRLVAAAVDPADRTPGSSPDAASVNHAAVAGLLATCEADFAVVRTLGRDRGRTLAAMARRGGSLTPVEEVSLIEALEPALREHLSRRPRFDSICRSNSDTGRADAAIVVRNSDPVVTILLGGIANADVIEEVGLRAVRRYYLASCDPLVGRAGTEAAILDDLRAEFGFFPRPLYQRRLDLFENELKRLEMVYQPVVDFLDFEGGREAEIYGWEALARTRGRSDLLDAPLGGAHLLFAAAELWGPKFAGRLDAAVFPRALLGVIEQARAQRLDLGRRNLSINCYASSLRRESFVDVIRDTLAAEADSFRRDSVTLEISEKTELPAPEGMFLEGERETAIRYLNELRALQKELGITFAIDDFGVGRSSPVRLDALRPNHVKIDRDVVRHPSGQVTMEFVLRLLSFEGLGTSKVIVEGYEGDGVGCSLGQILSSGVDYIQGYGLFRPNQEISTEITGLDQARIRDQLAFSRP